MWEEVGEGLKKVSVLFTEIEGKRAALNISQKCISLKYLLWRMWEMVTLKKYMEKLTGRTEETFKAGDHK